jgi:hypothetical protein
MRHRDNRSVERLPQFPVWCELALSFDPALRDLRMNRAATRFKKACPEPVPHN